MLALQLLLLMVFLIVIVVIVVLEDDLVAQVWRHRRRTILPSRVLLQMHHIAVVLVGCCQV